MKRPTIYWAIALLMAPWLAASAVAQQADRPTYDRVTVGGRFGGFSEAANLNDAGTADWRLGWMATVDATAWIHQYVGIRGGAGWAQDSLHGTVSSLSGRRKFNKFFYDGEVVLRYPVRTASGAVIPYVLGGAGAVTLHRLDSTDETFTKFAGNYGVGLEYRYKRIGFRAEGRDLVYQFDRYGFDKTQHGIVWDGGLTVSF